MQSLLPKLGEWRPTSSGRTTFNHQDAATGWSVTLTVDKADALSCQLWDLTLAKLPAPQPLNGAELHQRAAAIAERTTGLLEPLRVIEVDVQRGEALLRSDSPTLRKEKRSHYELALTAARRQRAHQQARASRLRADLRSVGEPGRGFDRGVELSM